MTTSEESVGTDQLGAVRSSTDFWWTLGKFVAAFYLPLAVVPPIFCYTLGNPFSFIYLLWIVLLPGLPVLYLCSALFPTYWLISVGIGGITAMMIPVAIIALAQRVQRGRQPEFEICCSLFLSGLAVIAIAFLLLRGVLHA